MVDESRHFLRQLSRAKARQEPPLFAAACAPCLALPMEIRAFLQRGSGPGLVGVVGREGWPRGRWTHSSGRRRGVGRPVRRVSLCEFFCR